MRKVKSKFGPHKKKFPLSACAKGFDPEKEANLEIRLSKEGQELIEKLLSVSENLSKEEQLQFSKEFEADFEDEGSHFLNLLRDTGYLADPDFGHIKANISSCRSEKDKYEDLNLKFNKLQCEHEEIKSKLDKLLNSPKE